MSAISTVCRADNHCQTSGVWGSRTFQHQIFPLWQPASLMVGREDELARLQGWFAEVRTGSLRIVFIAGEAGIGKTTFV